MLANAMQQTCFSAITTRRTTVRVKHGQGDCRAGRKNQRGVPFRIVSPLALAVLGVLTTDDELKTSCIMKPTFASFLLLSALLITGCDRALVLKTSLESNEKSLMGDMVLLDGAAIGMVRRVALDGGERAAEFAVTDEATKSKLRVGIIRLREDGRIPTPLFCCARRNQPTWPT